MKDMWRRAVCCLAGIILAVTALAGCDRQPAASSEPADDFGVISVPPPLDVDLSSLLTLEQVSAAAGVTMQGPQILENGATVYYLSEDARTTVNIHLEKVERTVYDTQIEVMQSVATEMQAVPNLDPAEDAWWNPETKELVLYGKGYMFSVCADLADESAEDCLVASRQLTALLLEKL